MNPRIQDDRLYYNGASIPAAYFQQLDGYQASALNGTAHGSRLRSVADGWANVLASEFASFDANLSGAWNGVDGGAYVATSVNIGGAGLQITGPLTVARGGQLLLTAAASLVLDGGYPTWTLSTYYAEGTVVVPLSLNGYRYQCTTSGTTGPSQPTFPTPYTSTVVDGTAVWTCLGPDGDWPQYSASHAGRTPTVVHSLVQGVASPQGSWRVRDSDLGVQSIAPMLDISDGNGAQPVKWIVPLRMFDNATVGSVTISFRVGFPHTQLPPTMPGARLVRLAPSGIPQVMSSTATGADANGYIYATKPTTVAAWAGQQTLTITCDQSNVVDVANYAYALEIIDEQGLSGWPWSLVMTKPVKYAGWSGFGGPTETGYPIGLIPLNNGNLEGWGPTGVQLLNDGDRVLLFANDLWSAVWIAHSGFWTFAPEMAGLTQGMVIPYTQITAAGGGALGPGPAPVYYQVASTSAKTWSAGTTPTIVTRYDPGRADYTRGTIVVPSTPNGFWYTATTAPLPTSPPLPVQTAGPEPGWPTTIGAQIAFGAIGASGVFTCSGTTNTQLVIVARGEQDDETAASAGTAFFAHGNIFSSCAVQYSGVSEQTFQ